MFGFSNVELTKKVLGFAVGAGTAKIVGSVIRNNVTPSNLYDKIVIGAAHIAIGMVVTEAARGAVDKLVDDIVGVWEKANVKVTVNVEAKDTIDGETA